MTLQNTALSKSGFCIISSLRELLNTCKWRGNELVKAFAYNDVNNALCLNISDIRKGILLEILCFV
jgi:hypothetical protein